MFELETVAADLGYGDVRPLSASVAWIDHLRDEGKRIALIDGGVRGEAALELAGLDGPLRAGARRSRTRSRSSACRPTASSPSPPRRGRRRRRAPASTSSIAVARGLATPEQMRRAGADAVVAELHELL